MGTHVDALLRRVAQELRPRTNQSADVLVRRIRSEVPEPSVDEDIADLVAEETAGHITTFLDVLEHGGDEADYTAPPQAVEMARLYARNGVPISSLLRAYRLGHLAMLQLLQGEILRLTDDAELVNAAAMRLMEAGFAYVDRGSEQVVAAYQEERDLRLRRRLVLTNEASRRIGTTLDVGRTARELADVGTDGFAALVTVDLLDSVLDGEGARTPSDPPPLRRVAHRSVSGHDPGGPSGGEGRTHTYPEGSEPADALTTGRPGLFHSATSGTPGWWPPDTDGNPHGFRSALLLPLVARGDTLGLAQFFRDESAAPFDQEDLTLAQEIAARAAVSVDNARRYTHERSTALTLQRSLLPRHTVEQSAVVAASRYLPSGSRAGVGGDWFDVIPLSGARVALVVGDVVGRGLHAAATMGRLRTAVRAFADIDLMPDELLTHLDDVVIRLQREEGRDDGELGATCLYAVYDPVSRICSLASAGHVLPALATPVPPADGDGDDGPKRSARFLDMPIGPPLGLGGLPFETEQFELAEGSLLALYTDGLIQRRAEDVDAARTTLCDTLATAPGPPDEVCDRLLAALLSGRPADDVALLVARTLALDPGHVATLDLPSDPAAVSGARRFTSDTLSAWGLDDLSFGTELMVSELVTNAIRYGKSPVRLRLIRQASLTCEVFDASSTAPHLRRARTFDEGGRGLLLVAQIADRWGTRHSREGKVIWAEQALPRPLP
ncbi:SpoIIE family protein phosphatase [Streptomyces sp. NPDC057494]|uniref:ATP-binding SpoIIE family protein phosphatase n=1 Tax=Streptomyces sp. NPDC057494 TaxID=3346148 RepID=UPI00368EB975